MEEVLIRTRCLLLLPLVMAAPACMGGHSRMVAAKARPEDSG